MHPLCSRHCFSVTSMLGCNACNKQSQHKALLLKDINALVYIALIAENLKPWCNARHSKNHRKSNVLEPLLCSLHTSNGGTAGKVSVCTLIILNARARLACQIQCAGRWRPYHGVRWVQTQNHILPLLPRSLVPPGHKTTLQQCYHIL